MEKIEYIENKLIVTKQSEVEEYTEEQLSTDRQNWQNHKENGQAMVDKANEEIAKIDNYLSAIESAVLQANVLSDE